MNDLPQRPKFYLHCSRRFWGGLILLLFLLAWWGTSACTFIGFIYERQPVYASSFPPTVPSAYALNFSIGQNDGGLEVTFRNVDNAGVPPPMTIGSWYTLITTSYRLDFKPRLVIGSGSSVFIPLWPLPLLWAILWPFWIRRGDKVEEERFGSG